MSKVKALSKKERKALANNSRKSGSGKAILDREPVADAEAVTLAKQMYYSSLRDLEPRVLMNALDGFKYGELSHAARIWHDLRGRDDRLITVAPKREEAPAARTYDVMLVKDAKGNLAARQKDTLEYFWGNVSAVNAFDRNITGGFGDVVEYIMRAVGDQYSAQHILWKPSGNGKITAEFEYVPLFFFENYTGKLRYLGPMGMGINGEELSPINWLVCGRKVALMEPSSVLAMIKRNGLADWCAFNEKFGLPFPIGETSAPRDSEEWEAMVHAVGGIINDGAAVISEGSKIHLMSASNGSGGGPFGSLIDRCDRAMTSGWLGADLATMSRGGANNSGASLQGNETLRVEARDCEWVSQQLQRVDKLVLEYVYGRGCEILAYTVIDGPVLKDIKAEMQIDEFCIKQGLSISKADLAERYQRPQADEGEPLAGAQADAKGLAVNSGTSSLARQNDEQRLREAVNQDLKPVYDALLDVLAGNDDEILGLVNELEKQWPAITEAVLKGAALESAMENVFSQAFLNGLDADVKQLVADNL